MSASRRHGVAPKPMSARQMRRHPPRVDTRNFVDACRVLYRAQEVDAALPDDAPLRMPRPRSPRP